MQAKLADNEKAPYTVNGPMEAVSGSEMASRRDMSTSEMLSDRSAARLHEPVTA